MSTAAGGTEVAGMLMENSMDSAAGIMTVEGTTLVSTIMADSAAIGSGIDRTGQSTMNRTAKRVVQGSPRTWNKIGMERDRIHVSMVYLKQENKLNNK